MNALHPRLAPACTTLLFWSVWLLLAPGAHAQTTAFTYQGHLTEGGASANGAFDLKFSLYDAVTNGSLLAASPGISPVNTVNGIFTVPLDFGSTVMGGGDRWLEIAVRPSGSADPYTVLSPRQKLTSAPYAVRALSAGTAANASSLAGSLISTNVPTGLLNSSMLENGTILDQDVNAAAGISTSKLATSSVDNMEFGYLDGVTSGIQGQFSALNAGLAGGLAGKLNLSGGTMTGALFLPPNGLNVGGTQLVTSGGRVGIGMTPTQPLEVNGPIKLGTSAEAASAANAGTMRYSSGRLQISNGAAWADTGPRTLRLRHYIMTSGYFPADGGVAPAERMLGEVFLTTWHRNLTNAVPCDGRELLISTYTTLFSLIGFTYGGNGTTTFRVPNLDNVVPVNTPTGGTFGTSGP